MTQFKRQTRESPTFVRKLDDDEYFDDIPTKLKTTVALKQKDRERYNVWYGYFKTNNEKVKVGKTKSNLLWVGKHWKDIEDHIKSTYVEPNYALVSQRHHLEGLSNVLLSIDKDKFREIVRPMFNKGKEIQIENDNKRDEGLLGDSELQNFVTYTDLVAQRDRLYEEWQKDLKNKKLNIYHLIVALNTYIPPLRRQYHNMELWFNKKEPPSDVQTNYLWEKTKGKFYIVLNHDKIENKRVKQNKERQIIDISDEIEDVTDGNKLNEILAQSIKHFKREYVLSGIRTGGGSPMSTTSYDQALASVFSPKHPTTNILRKAYINHFHSMNLSPKKLKQIAFRMRHTLNVAQNAYRKINVPLDYEPVQGMAIKQPKTVPPPQPKVPKFKPKEYMAEYRKKNKDKFKQARHKFYADENKRFCLLRDKIIRTLNNGKTSHPTKKSMDKYGIFYNKELSRWDHDPSKIVNTGDIKHPCNENSKKQKKEKK